jgi:hypothetical protein
MVDHTQAIVHGQSINLLAASWHAQQNSTACTQPPSLLLHSNHQPDMLAYFKPIVATLLRITRQMQ